VRTVISTEMNSATDNPIVFAERGEIISAGNFHGEYPAKALDYLAIGIHELAAMSERRIERLVNPGKGIIYKLSLCLRVYHSLQRTARILGQGRRLELRIHAGTLHRGSLG